MAKNTSTSPLKVDISLSFNVTPVGQHSWNDPYGRADFSVTLPVESIKAVDLSVLIPGMLAQAIADWGVKNAEAERKLEAERMAEVEAEA